MNKINYQKEMEKTISGIKDGEVPHLLLHACCAPCSSYCLESLSEHFEISVYFYNPNISPKEEYEKRVAELRRFAAEVETVHPVHVIEGPYEPERFFQMAKGLEEVPEGGERCFRCFQLRLSKSAEEAKHVGADYFTTSLTISPLKNAAKLNEIGCMEGQNAGVPWLFSDFKKKNGYKRSIELSKQYDLYRQNYCGCVFSKIEAEKRQEDLKEN